MKYQRDWLVPATISGPEWEAVNPEITAVAQEPGGIVTLVTVDGTDTHIEIAVVLRAGTPEETWVSLAEMSAWSARTLAAALTAAVAIATEHGSQEDAP